MHIAFSVLIIRLKGFLFSDGFLNLISNDNHIIERSFSDSKEVIEGALIPGFSLMILSISSPKSFIDSFVDSFIDSIFDRSLHLAVSQ